ncbi:sensor histidine kinase [Aquimarina litoralis]|uniref:sensor histidine kinase n=1 Tax=Aquimarina litoralis TaxID=584605 RepID=UPI001C580F7D|nr:sensor histidine kinase [Aquimarina litoralis]
MKKYRAIPYGFIILFVLVKALEYIDFIRLDPKETLVNIIGFIFWGLIVSAIINAMLFHKKERVFYWMVASWAVSLLGFIFGKPMEYKIVMITCAFLFFITSVYILWSWYMQRYKKRSSETFLRERKLFLIKLILLSIVFIIMFVVDHLMNIPDNPITFVLLTLFWIVVFYILAPKFFQKYRLLIIVLYASLLIFFWLFILSFDKRTHEQNMDLFLVFLFPVPLFIILWMYDQWKWFQNLKADKAKAELALLRQQVNPHFFFNTLNNLYGLAKRKSDLAPELILKLSEIMRYVIYKGKETEVTIEEEIEYLENYIELQEIRHHQKVDIQFTKNIMQNGIMLPPLLFIILLENAFKHGVDSLMYDAYVHVNLEIVDNKIIFEVSNNYDASALNQTQGIGLENLKKRLNIIYDHSYTLDFNIEEEIFSACLTINI